MNFKKNFFLLIVLTIIFVYITNISSIPENLVLFQNENYEMNLLKGIELKKDISSIDTLENQQLTAVTTLEDNEKNGKIKTDFIGNIKLKLTALGIIPIKDISVSVVPERLVIPVGETLGVKLYSKGVLVVGKSIVEGIDGTDYEPYSNTNIEVGDIILKIDERMIETIDDLKEAINMANGKEMIVEYEDNGIVKNDKIKAVKTLDGNYKIGLWVRDGTMGIGTLSFVDVETGRFAALGHGVSDMDTKKKITINEGTLNDARLISITKGEKDSPGEILGVLREDKVLGKIEKNTDIGIYGTLTAEKLAEYRADEAVKIASRKEIELGKATILCTLEPGKTEEFEIEIQKKYLEKNANSKCMIVKITDERLLEKTGGIIQGMSGSPILQNGKLIRKHNACPNN